MGRISKADHFLIIGLWKERKWGAKRLMKEFPGKRRPKTSITLLQKIDNYGTIEMKSGKHNNDAIVTSQSNAVNK